MNPYWRRLVSRQVRPLTILFYVKPLEGRVVKSSRAVVGVAEGRVLALEGSCSIPDVCERWCVSLSLVLAWGKCILLVCYVNHVVLAVFV